MPKTASRSSGPGRRRTTKKSSLLNQKGFARLQKKLDFRNPRVLVMAALAAIMGAVAVTSLYAATASYSLWGTAARPATVAANDAKAVELGVRFQPAQDGYITHIKYYKSSKNTGTHTGRLWSNSGQLLATATFTSETTSGWQRVKLDQPVAVKANSLYVASYHTPTGYYSANNNYFDSSSRSRGPLTAPRSTSSSPNGVYKYGNGGVFPTDTYRATNYWVDVVFTASAPPTTPTPPAPTPTPTPEPTPTPAPTPAPTSGWPNNTNTGYKNAPGYPGSLTNFSGTIQSNTTYRFMNFGGGLAIPSGVTNVTFYGCRFASNAVQDANVRVAGDNITFDYSTFEPSAVSAPPVAFGKGYQYGINQTANVRITVDHSDFWGFGNGIQFGYSTQAKPLIVRNSWFHDASAEGSGTSMYHTDGILSNNGGPSYMVFDHNTIASPGNTQGLALQTEAGDQPYDHVTITNNYFSGFGYTVAIAENLPLGTNITFTGNTFGTDFKPLWGPLYSEVNWSSAAGNIWRNNKWRVVPGSYYTNTADDGKYWLPSGNKSATDYSG